MRSYHIICGSSILNLSLYYGGMGNVLARSYINQELWPLPTCGGRMEKRHLYNTPRVTVAFKINTTTIVKLLKAYFRCDPIKGQRSFRGQVVLQMFYGYLNWSGNPWTKYSELLGSKVMAGVIRGQLKK